MNDLPRFILVWDASARWTVYRDGEELEHLDPSAIKGPRVAQGWASGVLDKALQGTGLTVLRWVEEGTADTWVAELGRVR